MGDAASLLRRLPRVDDVLEHAAVAAASGGAPRGLAREAAREAVEEARAAILAGRGDVDVGIDAVAGRAAELLAVKARRSLRRCVNATGVVLHTGLGRAPLSEPAREALADVSAGYSNLQADIERGERIEREVHVLSLLRRITGAESALVVNNNAAATVLALNALAAGREVVVSRGEMIEIGGSFRLPDIMKLAGCRLVEVGCTNRTHLKDYEAAITESTALLLSVHQSNYRIRGFTSQAPIGELAALARKRNLLCAHDLGSGALVDLRAYGLPHEPTVQESLEAGADCALFSGDKLLGGPQCGIIVGRSGPLEAMRKNPYYRAFRVGKLTFAALEATLRLFLDPEALATRHRVLSMLACPLEALRARAEALAARVRQECGEWLVAETREDESEVGGGSLAGHPLPTAAVRLRSNRASAEELGKRLRAGEPPVFTRIRDDSVVVDPRTVLPGEEDLILEALRRIGQSLGER